MSYIWNSGTLMRKSIDSGRRSSSKASKLRLSLGLNSPKSISNIKTTPSYLISTSVLTSISSNKGLFDKSSINQFNGSRRLPTNPSFSSKCSYKLDAANLIANRIRKFIYKHFSIWKLAMCPLQNQERRRYENKSLIVQVTASHDKKRVKPISVPRNYSSELLQAPSIKRPLIENSGPLKLSDFDKTLGTSERILKSFGSHRSTLTTQSDNFFTDRRNKRDSRCASSALKPKSGEEIKNCTKRVFYCLCRVYKRKIGNNFYMLLSWYLSKLVLIKVQKKLNDRMKRRLKGYMDIVIKSGIRAEKIVKAIRAISRAVRWKIARAWEDIKLCREERGGLLKASHLEARPSNGYFERSMEGLRKSIQEIVNSKERIKRFEANCQAFSQKAKPSIEVRGEALKVIKPILDSKQQAAMTISRLIQLSCQRQFVKLLMCVTNSRSVYLKTLATLQKNLSKDIKFRLSSCFSQWKSHLVYPNFCHLTILKLSTLHTTLSQLLKTRRQSVFNSLKFFNPTTRPKCSVNLSRAFKRFSRRVLCEKAKAFEKFKFLGFQLQTLKKRELKSTGSLKKLISSTVPVDSRFFSK